jgi:hypothetical protein
MKLHIIITMFGLLVLSACATGPEQGMDEDAVANVACTNNRYCYSTSSCTGKIYAKNVTRKSCKDAGGKGYCQSGTCVRP